MHYYSEQQELLPGKDRTETNLTKVVVMKAEHLLAGSMSGGTMHICGRYHHMFDDFSGGIIALRCEDGYTNLGKIPLLDN